MNGTLWLVPNALDLGAEPVDLREVLPDGVIRRAAALLDWVAEDARSARGFLKRVAAITPLAAPLQSIAVTELPRPRKGSGETVPATVWKAILAPAQAGRDVGLLSDAGMPAIADPGAGLVQAAHELGIDVQPLAGPSALLLALAASGLNGQNFAFVGYLPQEPPARATRLRALEALSLQTGQSQLFIETPYRNAALMASIVAVLAPRTRVSVSCGLTLAGGWSRTDTVAGWRAKAVVLPDRWPAVFAMSAA